MARVQSSPLQLALTKYGRRGIPLTIRQVKPVQAALASLSEAALAEVEGRVLALEPRQFTVTPATPGPDKRTTLLRILEGQCLDPIHVGLIAKETRAAELDRGALEAMTPVERALVEQEVQQQRIQLAAHSSKLEGQRRSNSRWSSIPLTRRETAVYRSRIRRLSARLLRIQARIDKIDAARDARVFAPLRREMLRGTYRGGDLLRDLAQLPETERQGFVLDLFGIRKEPEIERELGKDRFGYAPTPLPAILELAELLGPNSREVLYDLGSGMGAVVMVASFLTGAQATGVEFDPALARAGYEAAERLGLQKVKLINADVRDVHLSSGTVFYFFNPFGPEVMKPVLAQLEALAKHRPIRLVSLNTDTELFQAEPWLVAKAPGAHLQVFESVPPGRGRT